MNEALKNHITDSNVWMRLLFMVFFGFVYAVSRFVLLAVIVAEFFWLLFSGSLNPRLLAFGGQLANFVYQILRYLTFNTEIRPFPFADWPDGAELIRCTGGETSARSDDSPTEDIEEAVIVEPEGNDKP